jgi:hypothetical protein
MITGYVYKLCSDSHEEFYIGSTKQPLYKRMYGHKEDARKYPDRAVYSHFNSIGWDQCRMILIETVTCNTKKELEAREFHYIEQNRGPNLLNTHTHYDSHGRCPHGRIRRQCIDCGGSQICPHRRQKSKCIDCGGSQICPHRRRKQTCKECFPFRYYCYECEQSFSAQAKLIKHENSRKHKETFNAMFLECFGIHPDDI